MAASTSEHPDLPEIKDPYKRAVTTVILENQEKAMGEDRAFLTEAGPANQTGGVAELGSDPNFTRPSCNAFAYCV